MTGQLECWGPYRSSVDERLASCEDFVGRLRSSIDAKITPDRLYFGDKAHELRDAAQSLVDHVDDVEWWLGACNEVTEHTEPDGAIASLVECGRAAGHVGEHREEDECPEHQVLTEARRAAVAVRTIPDRLAWGLLRLLRAHADVTDAATLAGEVQQVQARLGALAIYRSKSSLLTILFEVPRCERAREAGEPVARRERGCGVPRRERSVHPPHGP